MNFLLNTTTTFLPSASASWLILHHLFIPLVKNPLKEFLNHFNYKIISLISFNVTIFQPLRFFFKCQLANIVHAFEATAEIYTMWI